jgi:dynein heavy chain 1
MIHEVRLRNQVIYLDPPVEIARQEWLFQFEDVLGAWTKLARISEPRLTCLRRCVQPQPHPKLAL